MKGIENSAPMACRSDVSNDALHGIYDRLGTSQLVASLAEHHSDSMSRDDLSIRAVLQFTDSAARGLGKPVQGQVPEMLVRPSILLLLLTLPLATNAHVTLQLVLGALAISTIAANLTGVWMLSNSTPEELKRSVKPTFDTNWSKSAGLFAGSAGINHF